jgi:hypothetical protein
MREQRTIKGPLVARVISVKAGPAEVVQALWTAVRAAPAWASSQGQKDQEQSEDQTEQADRQPSRAACHKAALDKAGALTNPDSTDENGKATDHQGKRARRRGPHLQLILIW